MTSKERQLADQEVKREWNVLKRREDSEASIKNYVNSGYKLGMFSSRTAVIIFWFWKMRKDGAKYKGMLPNAEERLVCLNEIWPENYDDNMRMYIERKNRYKFKKEFEEEWYAN